MKAPFRWAFASLLVTLAIPCVGQQQTSAPAIQQTPQELFNVLSPSVFVVHSFNKKGLLVAFGSGVSVTANTVITNCHVIETGNKWTLKQGNHQWPVAVIRRDATHDLCEVGSPSLNATPVVIRNSSEVKIGDRVYTIGAPKGLEASLSEGLISGLRGGSDGVLIQTTAPISPGSSGGGLFDSQGRLIGITTFQYRNSQNLNFALPSAWVLSLDKELRAQLSSVSGGPPQQSLFQDIMQFASDAFQAKDYDKAITFYTEALDMRPDDVNALTALGTIYLFRQQAPVAQTLCERAVRIDPKSVDGWACLGDTYSDEGKPNLAIDPYKRSLSLDPKQPLNWIGLGTVLGETGDRRGAVDVYDHLKELDSDYANLFYKRVLSKMTAAPAASALPEHWKDTLTAAGGDIHVEGDYVYEEADVQDPSQRVTVKTFCDTKRNGTEWDGSCRYSLTWTNSAVVCTVETQERILSITPSRIEGKSQGIDYSPLGHTPPTCPSAGTDWHDFALVPRP